MSDHAAGINSIHCSLESSICDRHADADALKHVVHPAAVSNYDTLALSTTDFTKKTEVSSVKCGRLNVN